MKAISQYMKKLLERKRRDTRAEEHRQRRIQDLDFERHAQEPEEMPDWARAIRAADNDIRSV